MSSFLPFILLCSLSFVRSSFDCRHETIQFFWTNDDSSYYNVAIYNEHRLRQETPLIFLHGFLGTRHVWNLTRDDLLVRYHHKMRNHPMIMISYRGHGDSIIYNTDKIRWTVQDIADEIIDIIVNKLNIDKFILIGHCYGGSLSILIALNYPQKVEKLVLVGSAAYFSSDVAAAYKAHCSKAFIESLGGRLKWCKYSIDDVFRMQNRLKHGHLEKGDYDFHLIEACQVTMEAAQYILPEYVENWDIRGGGMDALSQTNIAILFVAGSVDSLSPFYQPFVDSLSEQQLTYVTVENGDRYLFIEQEFVTVFVDQLFNFIF